jgi:mannose-6-phosphate isomerase
MPLRKLEPHFHGRVWGARDLNPWFPDAPAQVSGLPIGEVWFETPEVPLLVKFLFTEEDLSVQAHPDDAYAGLHHASPGKTEMWRVLAARKGAKVAAGFREPVTREQVRAAALDGSIVNLLEWFEARAGDTFFIPAGTVHAIGAGLTICEIQQRSDVTYRLHDYGRGRELHLDHGLTVSQLSRHAARGAEKVVCPHFVTEPLDVAGRISLAPQSQNELLIAIEGEGDIGGHPIRSGEVFLIPANLSSSNLDMIEITGTLRLLRTSSPCA